MGNKLRLGDVPAGKRVRGDTFTEFVAETTGPMILLASGYVAHEDTMVEIIPDADPPTPTWELEDDWGLSFIFKGTRVVCLPTADRVAAELDELIVAATEARDQLRNPGEAESEE